MKLNRLELLRVLKTLAPAIAGSRNKMQELACVWFDGEHASAFNDVLGIRAVFETEFTGGVLGEKLIGVIERSRAKEVDVTLDGEDALFKIGAARIKLARRPIEDWFWNPEVPEHRGFSVTDAFRDAVGAVLLSVGSANVLNPEQRGITVIQNGKTTDLYSTDAVSLSWVRVDTGADKVCDGVERLILPTPFCEQLKLVKQKAELRFDENAVYCLTSTAGPDGAEPKDVLIFSKLVEEDSDPVSFDEVVQEYNRAPLCGVEIPGQFKLRAERAMVMLGDQTVELEIEDNHLYLYAQTPYGEVDDVLKIGDHPDVKAKLDMALVHRALDGCDHMLVAEKGVVMTGPKNYTYIVAAK